MLLDQLSLATCIHKITRNEKMVDIFGYLTVKDLIKMELMCHLILMLHWNQNICYPGL